MSLRAERPNELIIAPYLAVAYYGLNMNAAEPFAKNKKLREALSEAIDRRRLVETLAAGQLPAFGIVPPGIRDYAPVSSEWQNMPEPQRIAEAKRLYAEAGFSVSQPLHLRLLLNSNPSIKQTAILVAAMWQQELGVLTDITDEEFKVFLDSRQNKDRWDVIRLAWNADYNDASSFLDIFRTGSVNNATGYASSQFDLYLDRATQTLDPDSRRRIMQNAEKLLLSDYSVIPIYYFVSKHLVKPYVVGFEPNPFDRIKSQSLMMTAH